MIITLIVFLSMSANSQEKVTKQDQFELFENHFKPQTNLQQAKMPIHKPNTNLDKQINIGFSTSFEKILMPIYKPLPLALTNTRQRLWFTEMVKKLQQSKK